MNKYGLSTIIATLILILMTVILVGIVWSVVANLTKDKLDQGKNCLDVYEKVKLENEYTCYNLSSKKLVFSLSIADIDVDEVLVGIEKSNGSSSFSIKKAATAVTNLSYYNGTAGAVALPGKNSGIAYAYLIENDSPKKIQVAPKIGGNQCDVTSTILNVPVC